MRRVFLYIPSTRGRTRIFLKQIIGSDNPRVIIGFTCRKIGGCYGMISSTTVAPSAHICVHQSPISRNKVTSPGGMSPGTTAHVQFFSKTSKLFLTSQLSNVKSRGRCSEPLWGFTLLCSRCLDLLCVISSSSLINSSAGPAVFRQR